MRTCRILWLSLVVSVGLVSCAYSLPTVEQIVKDMTAAAEKATSFEADTRNVMQEPRSTQSTTGHIATQQFAVDGKTVSKCSIARKVTKKTPDGKEEADENKFIDDGVFIWIEQRNPQTKEVWVTKSDSGRSPQSNPMASAAQVLSHSLKNARLTLVGEDTLEGQKMYVLESNSDPAKAATAPTTKAKYWVGQTDLFLHRTMSTYKEPAMAKPMSTTIEYLKVKINQPIDPALFAYTPPEGAKFTDESTKPKP